MIEVEFKNTSILQNTSSFFKNPLKYYYLFNKTMSFKTNLLLKVSMVSTFEIVLVRIHY